MSALEQAIAALVEHKERFMASGQKWLGSGSYLFVEIDKVAKAYENEHAAARGVGRALTPGGQRPLVKGNRGRHA